MEENHEKPSKGPWTKNIGYVVSMGVLFLILGLIISTEFKDYISIQRSGVPASRQINELVLILKQAQSKKSDLQKQLSEVKHQLNETNKNTTDKNLLNAQFKKIYEIAGLTSLKGSGLIIKLEDQKNKSHDNASSNDDGRVHSDDLLKIVNELKASGAKAIVINNQRLITRSEIVTAGSNIVVNQSKMSSPFLIKAIGPEDTMYTALNLRGGILEYIEVFGVKVTLTKDPAIEIPQFKGNF